ETLRISHRDLYPSNVIWQDEIHPTIIDWELSGYIHPIIELIGVAQNWGGVNSGNIQRPIYDAVLRGYGHSIHCPESTSAWKPYIIASLGSWLQWICLFKDYMDEAPNPDI